MNYVTFDQAVNNQVKTGIFEQIIKDGDLNNYCDFEYHFVSWGQYTFDGSSITWGSIQWDITFPNLRKPDIMISYRPTF